MTELGAARQIEWSEHRTRRYAAPLVLLVDDDESLRSLLVHGLEFHGFRVIDFAQAQPALDYLCSRDEHCDTPAAIVCDLIMPGISGIELLRQLQALQDGNKVIVITAFDDSIVGKVAHRLGAVSVLCKPFSLEQLVKALNRIVTPPR
jgi:CheY-like chemotaxis protein